MGYQIEHLGEPISNLTKKLKNFGGKFEFLVKFELFVLHNSEKPLSYHFLHLCLVSDPASRYGGHKFD